ncbi:hypothetical protein CBL_03930 [Carabus blaptoides fortunei]
MDKERNLLALSNLVLRGDGNLKPAHNIFLNSYTSRPTQSAATILKKELSFGYTALCPVFRVVRFPVGNFMNKKTRQEYSYATRMLTDITLPSINGRFTAFVKNQQNSEGDQETSGVPCACVIRQIVISTTPLLGNKSPFSNFFKYYRLRSKN